VCNYGGRVQERRTLYPFGRSAYVLNFDHTRDLTCEENPRSNITPKKYVMTSAEALFEIVERDDANNITASYVETTTGEVETHSRVDRIVCNTFIYSWPVANSELSPVGTQTPKLVHKSRSLRCLHADRCSNSSLNTRSPICSKRSTYSSQQGIHIV
jgi:hypothetical protein